MMRNALNRWTTSPAILKGWEQGHRQPDATAATYLSIIEKLPHEARAVLEG